MTGAGSGIGRAIAIVLGAAGYRMLLTGRVLENLQATAQAIEAAGGLAAVFSADLAKRDRIPFRYRDKGQLAVIGRGQAVADLGWIRTGGFLAWQLWIWVHIFFLIGFRNRVVVLFEWAWSYLTFQRGARVITEVWRPARG